MTRLRDEHFSCVRAKPRPAIRRVIVAVAELGNGGRVSPREQATGTRSDHVRDQTTKAVKA
jgi:hypothetical protein